MNKTLLIATHNRGKLHEYQQIFADLPLHVVSLDEIGVSWDVDESGQTFAENARLKAQAYCAATQLLTLADDSGLEVDALGGEPGVRSARYAGPNATATERNQLLLERLKHLPQGQRQARFRCVIALAQPNHAIRIVEGECLGEIAFAPRGRGGFGYDPLFFMPSYNCTMAQLCDAEKNRVSHRGRAAEGAKVLLAEIIRGV